MSAQARLISAPTGRSANFDSVICDSVVEEVREFGLNLRTGGAAGGAGRGSTVAWRGAWPAFCGGAWREAWLDFCGGAWRGSPRACTQEVQVDAEGPLRHWLPLKALLASALLHTVQLRICRMYTGLLSAFMEGASTASESLPLGDKSIHESEYISTVCWD